jgi:hypothetical protein
MGSLKGNCAISKHQDFENFLIEKVCTADYPFKGNTYIQYVRRNAFRDIGSLKVHCGAILKPAKF